MIQNGTILRLVEEPGCESDANALLVFRQASGMKLSIMRDKDVYA
jgi:hypothetical protein